MKSSEFVGLSLRPTNSEDDSEHVSNAVHCVVTSGTQLNDVLAVQSLVMLLD